MLCVCAVLCVFAVSLHVTFRVGSDLLEVQVWFRFGSSLVHVLWSSGLLDELGIHMSAVRVCCSFACYLHASDEI